MADKVKLKKTIKRHGRYFKPGHVFDPSEFDSEEGARLVEEGVLQYLGKGEPSFEEKSKAKAKDK